MRNDCKECRVKTVQLYTQQHAEAVKIYQDGYYQINRRSKLEKQNIYNAANRIREAARSRLWRRNNLERHQSNCRRWYRANRNHALADKKRYYKENPQIVKRNRVLRKARMRGATIEPFTAQDWLTLLEIYAHRCAYCRVGGKMTVDHVVPIARGGIHGKHNIVPACPSCNASKQARSVKDFMETLHGRR